MLSPMLTIEQAAERLSINRDGVSALIKSKQLPGVNVNRDPNAKRPTWRIREEDLTAFELARLSIRTATPQRPRKAAKPLSGKAWF